MSIIPIRRPHYSPRGVLLMVQQIANDIAKVHGGKVPDVSLIDIRLRQRHEADPGLIDLDKVCRDQRKFWERANNNLISSRPGPNLFVPGAYVTLGKSTRGRMDSLDPYADITAWRLKDEEIEANFKMTMDRRRNYQLQRLEEATLNPDCKTLGELEARLHGYVPAPGDHMPFTEKDVEDDD